MSNEPENATPAAPPSPTPHDPKGHSTPISDRKPVLAAIAAGVAILAFGAGAILFGGESTTAPAPLAANTAPARPAPSPIAAPPPRMIDQGTPLSFADLVEHVSPAVVGIVATKEQRVADRFGGLEGAPEEFQEFLRQFERREPRVYRGQAVGSGFIIDAAGYIVTNNHVVESASKISVKLADGREFEAKLVGADRATDVALLKIEGVRDLPTVPFGDDSRVRVGDWVVAVGNPFGLGGTVTAGIVSSIKRDIGEGPYTDFIQIDAPINQGNSGGPTFDLSGRVIGMNTAIYSPSGGSVGIGFAIPASIVQDTVRQIKDSGGVTRGWLGVEIQDVTRDVASSLGLSGTKGAIVSRVVAGSPADSAGLRQGDVVLAINGRDVDSSRDMTRRVGMLRPGEKATFVVHRQGRRSELSALITRRDDRRVASLDRPGGGREPGVGGNSESAVPALGLRMTALDDNMRRRLGLDGDITGVLITAVEPQSEAAEKGFRPGDVIVSVGNRDVRTPRDVEQGVRDAVSAGRDSALFLVTTRQGQRFVALRVKRG